MNFLAHIYLSAEIDELKIGNFIADSVKGKAYLKFPEMIQNGIILHRGIDSFTDGHPIVRKSTHRLFPFYSHYSGVIVDIFTIIFWQLTGRNFQRPLYRNIQPDSMNFF